MEVGIILTVVLVGLVAGDIALVRALTRRRRGTAEDEQAPGGEGEDPPANGEDRPVVKSEDPPVAKKL